MGSALSLFIDLSFLWNFSVFNYFIEIGILILRFCF